MHKGSPALGRRPLKPTSLAKERRLLAALLVFLLLFAERIGELAVLFLLVLLLFPYTRTWPPFFSSFFFSSPAKAGALNVTATATAIIAIIMLFIISHPPLMFEYCAIHRHLLRVISKLDAASLMSTSMLFINQLCMFFELHLSC